LALDSRGGLWCVTSDSRPFAGRLSHYDGTQWQSYPVLRENTVASLSGGIAVDREDNVWVGTLGSGVLRFDGTGWSRLDTLDGLPDGYVYGLSLDSGGRLWAGTMKGAARRDGAKWTTYTHLDSLADDWVVALVPDGQDRLIAGTQRGVSLFDGNRWTTLPTRTYSTTGYDIADAVIRDRQGRIWTSLRRDGAAAWDGSAWTTYGPTSSAFPSSQSTCFALDSLGFLWCGTVNGLCRFDGRQWRAFDTRDGLPDMFIANLLTDRAGNLWISTYYGGLSFLPAAEIASLQETPPLNPDIDLKFYDRADGLADNTVLCTAIDSQGNRWFGTQDGISRYDGTGWTTFRPDSSRRKDNYCRRIALDTDGSLWFVSLGSGVLRYDGHSWSRFTTADGLLSDMVNDMCIDSRGVKWFGTNDGLSRYDGVSWTGYTTAEGLLDNSVNALAVDRAGVLWCAVSGGVNRYDGAQWQAFRSGEGPLNDWVNRVSCDRKNNVWFAGSSKGVCRYDGQSWTVFDSTAGLAGNRTRSLLFDRYGQLWVTTAGSGVCRFDGASWTSYSVRDGLASNFIYDIVQDSDGAYWLGGGGGVNLLRLKQTPQPPAGDVNADGRRDVFDLLALLRLLSGAEPDPDRRGDLNSDGRMDVFDLLALLKALSGW
ncbi:dockerin type I domain-containing protein, partial [bacterium]|nr:dockerin type I domain-containing protein [bacterium]